MLTRRLHTLQLLLDVVGLEAVGLDGNITLLAHKQALGFLCLEARQFPDYVGGSAISDEHLDEELPQEVQ